MALAALFAILLHLALIPDFADMDASPLLLRLFPALPPLPMVEIPDLPLLVIIALCGAPLLAVTLVKIARGDIGVDALAALSVIAAAWLHEYLAATIIILMMAGGQTLEAYAMRKASSALAALAERMPALAHRCRNGMIEDIPVADIRIGDQIVIYPHEACPADGTVLEGHGSMDESYLTGEPYTMSKAIGAPVLSGAINGETALVIRANRLPSESRYAKIMQVMEEAEQKRPALRRLGDQIGTLFTPVVLAFAGGVWYLSADPVRFLSVLTIATPCPILIAIPVTLASAVSMAARRGIIIRDQTVLERLPTCQTAIFDKTGTLTLGRPELTEIIPAEGIHADGILQYTASLERYSKHPLAGAIIEAARKSGLDLLEAGTLSEKPGEGLKGTIMGSEIAITHRRRLLEVSPQSQPKLPPVAGGLECIILLNGNYAATLRFRDSPREESRPFIGHLAPLHHFRNIILLSGDRESEVAHLAKLLGITQAFASRTPEQKVEIIRAETAKAPTLFMGDGINDAPALAAATVGIAFGHHSSVTVEAAGAVIMDNTLIKVDELIHISYSMRRIALQSAIGGIIFSVIGMGFAAAGYVTPVMGAVLQEIIDVISILNALRLTWKSNTLFASDFDRK